MLRVRTCMHACVCVSYLRRMAILTLLGRLLAWPFLLVSSGVFQGGEVRVANRFYTNLLAERVGEWVSG